MRIEDYIEQESVLEMYEDFSEYKLKCTTAPENPISMFGTEVGNLIIVDFSVGLLDGIYYDLPQQKYFLVVKFLDEKECQHIPVDIPFFRLAGRLKKEEYDRLKFLFEVNYE